jgi:hypothetical protein
MKKKQQPLNFSSTVLNHNQALLVKIITPDLNQPARERVSGLQRRVLINWPRDERRRESGGRRGEVWCRKPTYSTGAAERQDPDFLIDPRNKKTGKKRSTIKILYPPVQIAS